MSSAASSSSSSLGGLGGEKKLKKESHGTDFLIVRVCFVSVEMSLASVSVKPLLVARTLVSLLFRFDSDSQILVGLPINLFTFGVVVDKVTTVAGLLLVEV